MGSPKSTIASILGKNLSNAQGVAKVVYHVKWNLNKLGN